jgi:hypothetical protein
MTKAEVIVECRDRFLSGHPLTLAGVLKLLNKLDDPADKEPCEYCTHGSAAIFDANEKMTCSISGVYLDDAARKRHKRDIDINYYPNCGRKVVRE